MTETFVQLPEDGAGKKLRTRTQTVDGSEVHDQYVIPVGPVSVSGPVTDVQLRASAVPVSGPLTDEQLRAGAVPISGALTDTQLRATALPVSGAFFQATQPVSVAALPNLVGTWGYVAATLSGAGNVTGVGRCIGISVYAQTDDGSFNIGGGNTITVRAGTGLDIVPYGNPSAPVVNWVSGTLDIIIESLT